jgi:hypothetical protein
MYNICKGNKNMRTKTDMIRKDFYITKNQSEMMIKVSKTKGITFSELMRRIMDDYLEKASNKKCSIIF